MKHYRTKDTIMAVTVDRIEDGVEVPDLESPQTVARFGEGEYVILSPHVAAEFVAGSRCVLVFEQGEARFVATSFLEDFEEVDGPFEEPETEPTPET